MIEVYHKKKLKQSLYSLLGLVFLLSGENVALSYYQNESETCLNMSKTEIIWICVSKFLQRHTNPPSGTAKD